MITLDVKNIVVLNDTEKVRVELTEALFFYHAWLRGELELLDIANDVLIAHCDNGKNSNYHLTDLCQEIDNLLEAEKLTNDQEEWLHETLNDASDMITEIYAIDGYACCHYEGNWGLWPNFDDC